MTGSVPKVESTFPALFAIADRLALTEQQRYFKYTLYGLIAAIVAAVGSAVDLKFAVGSRNYNGGGIVSCLAFLAGLIFAGFLLYFRPERAWYENRAAAESIKTLCWQYCVKGGIFGSDDAKDGLLFERMVLSILDRLDHAGLVASGGNETVTDEMTAFRSLPLERRREIYREQRVLDQNTYYAGKARKNRALARGWALVAIFLELIGLVLGVFKAFAVFDADLLGVFATAAAGAIAWVQTKDCQNLSDSYQVATNELAVILHEARSHPATITDEQWAAFVAGGERAISREHTLWLARRDPRLNPSRTVAGPAPGPVPDPRAGNAPK